MARRRLMYDALEHGLLSSTFGTIGIFMMLGNLVVMTFYLELELEIVMSAFVALCLIYCVYRMSKRRVTFVIEF